MSEPSVCSGSLQKLSVILSALNRQGVFIMQKKSGPPKPKGPIYIHRGSGEYLENVTLLFISFLFVFYT